MSKVKDAEYFTSHDKAKHRRSLRRQEVRKLKEKRMQRCQDHMYTYLFGYYVKDHRMRGKRYTVEVPERYRWVQEFSHYEEHELQYTNQRGEECICKELRPVYKNTYVMEPAHTVVRRGYDDDIQVNLPTQTA